MDQEDTEIIFGSEKKLNMLIRELDMESISIGSPGFYTINYGFLSQVYLFFTFPQLFCLSKKFLI